jgi:TonB-dependent SusC/RagA subfamily outer membrane receptor
LVVAADDAMMVLDGDTFTTNADGMTGDGISVRSPVHFRSTEAPLTIVDGVIRIAADPPDISAEEIETMEVVRGAAAAALYGARAANGAIIITTKKK